jgi:hypothetical protein
MEIGTCGRIRSIEQPKGPDGMETIQGDFPFAVGLMSM